LTVSVAGGDIVLGLKGSSEGKMYPANDGQDVFGRDAGSTEIASSFGSSLLGLQLAGSDNTVLRFNSIGSVSSAAANDTITITQSGNTFQATVSGSPSSSVTLASSFGSSISTSTVTGSTSALVFSSLPSSISANVLSGETITLSDGGVTATATISNISGSTINLSSAFSMSGGSSISVNGGITTTITGAGIPINSAFISAGSAFTPSGGATTTIDRAVTRAAWKNIFTDNVTLNGEGRIDLDSDDDTSIRSSADDDIVYEVGGTDRFKMTTSQMLPVADNSYDLGSASLRYRNIFTGDLNLQNDRGDWTLIEENDFISFRNNKTGRRFRMIMEDITGLGNYGPGNDGEM